MTKDCAQWSTGALSKRERWIVEMGVGYFSAAEGIVGDSVLHVIEDNLTAAELKHASLRQIAEESIHMDSLLHIICQPEHRPRRGDREVQRHPERPAQKRVHHAPHARAENGHRPHADREQAEIRQGALRHHASHGGDAILRALRDDPLAAPAEQDDRHRPDVPIHPARRVEPHRARPIYSRGADQREPRHLDRRVPAGARRLHERRRRAGEGIRRATACRRTASA